jgi:hypothetical protein
MDVVLQVLLALLVPIGWGLLSAYLFDLFRARRARGAETCEQDVVEHREAHAR